LNNYLYKSCLFDEKWQDFCYILATQTIYLYFKQTIIMPKILRFKNFVNQYYLSILICIGVSVFLQSCSTNSVEPTPVSNSKPTADFNADFLYSWTDLQLKLIRTTSGYSPPVAARALGYSHLAIYESVVHGMPDYQSLAGQINGLATLPKPDQSKEYNWASAANAAMATMLNHLYASTSTANKNSIDSLHLKIEGTLRSAQNNQDVSERSVGFGIQIANALIAFAKQDGGDEAWNNNFPSNYRQVYGLGAWEPTGSQKIPLLPYWGKNKTFALANMSTKPTAPYTFSYAQDSPMYKQAKEVYEVGKNLTVEQKMIALYWADGANTITPPGHHINIAKIILSTEKAKLDKAAEVFAKVGLAINDAFVACWRAKFTHNLMRPITYINKKIDPAWKPYLETPPFPEYTSGHSSCSGAVAEILTSIYGDNYAFTDNTYQGKYANRSFKSFYAYADEAAVSRMYGGIHYRQANENGMKNGKNIALNILKFKFKNL